MQRKNWELDPEIMISPEEITDIMERAATAEDITRALDIAKEYYRRNGEPIFKLEDWHLMCMLSNVYQAGRIQGIREERAAKKGKPITA